MLKRWAGEGTALSPLPASQQHGAVPLAALAATNRPEPGSSNKQLTPAAQRGAAKPLLQLHTAACAADGALASWQLTTPVQLCFCKCQSAGGIRHQHLAVAAAAAGRQGGMSTGDVQQLLARHWTGRQMVQEEQQRGSTGGRPHLASRSSSPRRTCCSADTPCWCRRSSLEQVPE